MKKFISLLLTTVLAASTITVPAFAAVHAKDEYGQTIYVEGDKLNNKVYPLSEAPEMEHTFTFNDVTFSNFIKNKPVYTRDAFGKQIVYCEVEIGIGGAMRSEKGDVEYIFHHGGFNNIPTNMMSSHGVNSDLVAYKTNTPLYMQTSSKPGGPYFHLDDVYITPYADGGRAADGSWNKGLTWQFHKNPDKVRSNGSYLDIFQIRVEHGTKVSYFEVRVTDNTKFRDTIKPAVPLSAYPEKANANPTDSRILVDGKEIAFDAYNINGNNYFKLRDVAYALRGTEKQFEVAWDSDYWVAFSAPLGAITMHSSTPYTVTGGEMQPGNGSAKTAVRTSSPLLKDGVRVTTVVGYNISNNNYFKLRDLGELFNFNVSWDGTLNTIVIDSSKPYTS